MISRAGYHACPTNIMPRIIKARIAANEPPWACKLRFGLSESAVELDADPEAIDYSFLVLEDDGTTHSNIRAERKALGDLLNTMKERRLDPQLQRLIHGCKLPRENCWPYLLIEGRMQADRNGKVVLRGHGATGWDIDAVEGKLRSVQADGVIVTYCESSSQLERTLMNLCLANRGTKVILPRRRIETLSVGQQILQAFPGVGPELIKALEEFAGKEPFMQLITLLNSQSAKDVSGLGLGTISKAREAMGFTGVYEDAIFDLVELPKGE